MTGLAKSSQSVSAGTAPEMYTSYQRQSTSPRLHYSWQNRFKCDMFNTTVTVRTVWRQILCNVSMYH